MVNALLFAAALGGLPGSARAESGGAQDGLSSVLADEKARQTFKEGIEAFDRRDFEAARVAFLQTFALKPSVPVVRRNLGLAEIFSGHYLDGARRLARVIHTTGEGTAEDRARMLDSLRKAEAHLERVTIEVNVEGADVAVDQVELGSSPLPFVWYVAPGPYVVQVSKAGFSDTSMARVARAGSVQHIRINLTAVAQPQSVPEVDPLVAGVGESGPSPWIIAGGAVATAAAIGAGIAFSVAADDNEEKVERLGEDLAPLRCQQSTASYCQDLLDAADQHDRQQRWAAVSFVAASAVGLGTVLYAIIASSGAESTMVARGSAPSTNVDLDLRTGSAELRLRGSF